MTSEDTQYYSTFDKRSDDNKSIDITFRHIRQIWNGNGNSDLENLLFKVQKRMDTVRGFSLLNASSRTNAFLNSEKKNIQKI